MKSLMTNRCAQVRDLWGGEVCVAGTAQSDGDFTAVGCKHTEKTLY